MYAIIVFTLTTLIGTVFSGYTAWSSWGTCLKDINSDDQNCMGYRTRSRDYYNIYGQWRLKETENDDCLLTQDVVNGNYSTWTEWEDCSLHCDGITTRTRKCNDPTPCNGGKNCTNIGVDRLTKNCGPVDGEWSDWGMWSTCHMPSVNNQVQIYGSGTYTRNRNCTKPHPQCGGIDCIGVKNETGFCKVTPPCLTSTIFDTSYLSLNTPMVVYTSAKVQVETETVNLCRKNTTVYYFWELYQLEIDVNGTVYETMIKSAGDTSYLKLNQGELNPGLYRVYVKIGYPANFHHWMEESLYLKVEHPPPNTFIMGGSGRIVGKGSIKFDGRSGSYSLKNQPGDPSGLIFEWGCLYFVSESIYNLLLIDISPIYVFNDYTEVRKWYQTNFVSDVEEKVIRINASTLYTHVKLFYNHTHKSAKDLDVNFKVTYLTDFNTSYYPNSSTGYDQFVNNNYTNYNYTVIETLPLSDFFQITSMEEMKIKSEPLLDKEIVLPSDNELVRNEFTAFVYELFNTGGDSFVDQLNTFLDLLSESYFTMFSLKNSQNLPGFMNSSFSDLYYWLDIVSDVKNYLYALNSSLITYEEFLNTLEKGLILSDYAGMDGFLQLQILKKKKQYYFLNFLENWFDTLFRFNSIDWNQLKNIEIHYTNWIIDDVINNSRCSYFNATSNGYAQLEVSQQMVDDGIGFLVYLKAINEGSVGYFTQYAQTFNGDPVELNIECRLNCMKKTATTSIMSLVATCSSCSLSDLIGAEYNWTLKNFAFDTRESTEYTGWKDMMLSETNSRKFVIKAGLAQNQGYIIEANVVLKSGQLGKSIWIIKTDYIPYGGSCSYLQTNFADNEWQIAVSNWKDEGFRSRKDSRVDWKEQLNYRIDQVNSEGSSMLYYGNEEVSYIKIKPGLEVDDYTVTLIVHILDIFKDYNTCIMKIRNILPSVTDAGDIKSISSYIDHSNEDIDYYYKTGIYKKVAMNTEVAGATISNLKLPVTTLDVDPSDWINLGVETLPDGSVVRYSFEQLWELHQHPLQKDSGQVIQNALYDFTTVLNEVAAQDHDASLDNIRQVSSSMGTVLNNKDYVTNSSASTAFEGNRRLIDQFVRLTLNDTYPKYEEYVTTCEGIIRVLSNALEGILPDLSADVPKTVDIYNIQRDLMFKEQFVTNTAPNTTNVTTETEDLTVMERAFIATQIALQRQMAAEEEAQDVESETPGLFDSLDMLVTVLEMLNNRKQLPVYVKKEKISTSLDKKNLADLIQTGYSQDSVNLQFGNPAVNTLDEQKMQVTVFESNPFTWDTAESKFITSNTVTVFIGSDGKAILPSKIKFQNPVSSKPQIIQVAVPTDPDEVMTQTIYYKMYWRNHEDSLVFGVNNAESSVSHVVYIRSNGHPTELDYDRKKSIEPTDWTSAEAFHIMVDVNLYHQPTVVYIGVVMSSGSSSTSSRRRRSVSLQNMTIVDYSVMGGTTGCRVWNNHTQKWDKDSCRPSLESTPTETVCICSSPPGNSFATTFYVPPNMIDFSSVFSKFDISNSAVLFTVICVIVAFIITCIWAYQQDRKDPEKWAISFLIDNAPSDEYLYMLTVYTGLQRNSGTKSNVSFVITDEITSTDVRYLDDGQHQGFGVGSIRRFVMSVSKRIKNPAYLHIWHDNSGKGNDASWYLYKVVLEDLQTNDRYLFLCNQWLSLDDVEGKVQSIIPVTDNTEMKSFNIMFREQTRENCTESYLWLSVLLRPEQSNFTRVQRLACCLTLLFLTMISNAMFYGRDTQSSKISLGPLKFSLAGIYISLISLTLTIPAVFIITYLFRNSRQLRPNKRITDMERFVISDTKTKKLPCGFQIIAWLLVISAVITSGFFLILYSMEWGKSKSEEWLLCFFLSFFESIFIMDPLKIIFLAVVFAFLLRKAAEKNQDGKVYNREALLEETKTKATSPVTFFIDVFWKKDLPLNPKRVSKLKIHRREVLKAEAIFTELLLYIVFLAVLYLISFSNRDVKWYQSKEHLDQQLVVHSSPSSNMETQRFQEIESPADFYTWLNDTLIPFVFPKLSVYGRNLAAYDRQFLQDEVNLRIGPVRLRQVRAMEASCDVLFWDDMSCYDKYSIVNEDDTNYCVGWKYGPCAKEEAVYNITSAAWKFVPSLDIWGLPTEGLHSTYGGGGYIADLGVNYQLSKQVLNDLYRYVWIDRKTRAVFTEFTLYNVNVNVFVYISLLCEFPEIGGVLLTPSIQHFRPYQHIGDFGLAVFISEIIVLIGIIVFLVKMGISIHNQGRQFFSELWNVIDFLILILFFGGFIMYIGRTVMINKSMDTFFGNPYKFVNFGHIATWDEMLNVVIGALVFLTTIRLMRVLNYNTRVTQLAIVLSHVAKDLFGCFIMFFIVYMAFVGCGYLIFGRYLSTYKTLLVSTTTITNAIIGKNSIDDLFLVAPVIGHIYYFLFVFFVIWILMTMLCATLNMGITEVRERAIPTPYGILDLISKLWNQVVASILMLNPKHHSATSIKITERFSEAINLHKPKDVDLSDLVIDELRYTG